MDAIRIKLFMFLFFFAIFDEKTEKLKNNL